jgi:hypothetical protein
MKGKIQGRRHTIQEPRTKMQKTKRRRYKIQEPKKNARGKAQELISINNAISSD